MRVVRGLEFQYDTDAAVTIGNFDGVHLGHQHLFDKLFSVAKQYNLKKVCLTFEPHPKDYFEGTKTKRLTLLKDKIKLLQDYGFDIIWIISFNKKAANLSPIEFIEKIANNQRLKYLVIGEDFRFGKNRAGNCELLREYAKIYSFKLMTIPDYLINNQRAGSNLIRDILTDNLQLAHDYLGKSYGFTGKVVVGQQKGTQIGYPTVNIHVKPSQLKLARGVYAVFITYNQVKYKAMANWGIRPTMSNVPALVLEAHIFDFNQDLYGKDVYIEFIAKTREEKKFGSLEELKLQLANDAKVIKKQLEITESI